MRSYLCFKLQPREILPGLPHPKTGCRAYAKNMPPYYAIKGKASRFVGRSVRVSCTGNGLILTPCKMGFYCVTYNKNCIYEKAGRGSCSFAAASRLFFYLGCSCLSFSSSFSHSFSYEFLYLYSPPLASFLINPTSNNPSHFT